MILGLLLALALAAPMLPAAPAAATVPTPVSDAADKLRCHSREPVSSTDPDYRGVECYVTRKLGRGIYSVRRYRNGRVATLYWKDWLSSGCVAHRKRIFVVPAGPGDWYDCKNARYAARRISGRVLTGA